MENLFKTYPVNSGVPGPHVLITAGVHGDEYEPIFAAERLVGQITGLLKKGKVTIVPVVNVSAFQLKSRCGADGLDLARTCPGRIDGTITEQVAFQISELIKIADYYIDMHTGGATLDIFPLAGYMLHSSEKVLETQRSMAEAFSFPVIWGTDNTPDGRTLSVARDGDVPAIYIECGGPEPVSENIINEYIEGCLNVLNSLSLLDNHRQKEKKYLYWVEDHRINSGHLQSKTPAPVDGLFLPMVKAGAIIRTGDLWGIIENSITHEQIEIRSNADGFVLLTRVKGLVNKDDSLGGILPLTEPGKITIDGTC